MEANAFYLCADEMKRNSDDRRRWFTSGEKAFNRRERREQPELTEKI
jgi:hypothetical protein